jgi:phosphatidylglycerophosphate synthase
LGRREQCGGDAIARSGMNAGDRRPLVLRGVAFIGALAAALARRGVSPNVISIWGLVCAIAAGCAWALTGWLIGIERLLWFAGFVLVLLRILANTLDGMVAVEHGKASRTGMLYNEAPDRLSDTALLIGAGYAQGGSVELGWLAACVALFVSYVRILGRLAGASSQFGGPMDKGGRMITLMAASLYMGLAPAAWHFTWGPSGAWGAPAAALGLIVIGGAWTAVRRLLRAAADLHARS